MDSNEKKEILETVVTYLTGALDEAKDELAVLEKAEAPEPEPPTLHHLDWGIDNKGDFLFFILNDGRFKAWTLYGGYCKDFTVEVTEDYIKDVSIKGNLQSIFEQLMQEQSDLKELAEISQNLGQIKAEAFLKDSK